MADLQNERWHQKIEKRTVEKEKGEETVEKRRTDIKRWLSDNSAEP